MKVKVCIEIYDDSKVRDLESIGLTPKFLEIGYHQFFEGILEKNVDSLADYTLSVNVEE